MILVGLMSTYLEGPLAREALRSLLEAEPDLVLVCEGPAGEELPQGLPETDLGGLEHDPRVALMEGRWRTDARKRTAMLERVHHLFGRDRSVWSCTVDGDEVLANGRFLRDWLQRLDWEEEVDEAAEFVGRPMRIVELDGRVSWVRSRLLRLDRIERILVSSSVFEVRGRDGKVHRYTNGGNEPDRWSAWEAPRVEAIEADAMFVMPPLGVEPYLLHRTHLRHPLRMSNRLHEQERGELARVGLQAK